MIFGFRRFLRFIKTKKKKVIIFCFPALKKYENESNVGVKPCGYILVLNPWSGYVTFRLSYIEMYFTLTYHRR